MNFQRLIRPSITIGDQPTEADLKTLKDEGYLGIVNLRQDGEPEQPLSTAAEGDKLRALGIDYLHYGVSSTPLTEEGVGAVHAFINEHAPGKVLVHCRKGGRAAALVLLHEALAQGWGADEAVENGKGLGLEVGVGLKGLVEDYLRSHPAGA